MSKGSIHVYRFISFIKFEVSVQRTYGFSNYVSFSAEGVGLAV